MVRRSLVVWLLMLGGASINGALRETLLIPTTGVLAGRAISTLILSVLVVLLTYFTIRWIRPRSSREAWSIGGLWVALTLGFEFIGGYFLFGNSWSQLLDEYNVLQGRIWVLVPITIAIAPPLCARSLGLLTRAALR
jgi:hypothetical protein